MSPALEHAASAVLPSPPFEGSEKRVEVDFLVPEDQGAGLRALTREQLDELMSLAHCCIVSSRSNASFDAYVLSESSLFVYPRKWVLKTCGTTRLLDSLPRLLEHAGKLGLVATRCKYSRASFLFPENQPSPYKDGFEEEVAFLNQHFGALHADGPQAYVLGEPFHGLQWHVYVSGRPAPGLPAATFNLEMCMTELDEAKAQAFFRTDAFVSSAHTTEATGISKLLPHADIDDYVFEPCGYSMNGIYEHQFLTIHVTPETGHSYASVEVSGHMEDLVDCSALLARAVDIFKPGAMSVALSVDDASVDGAATWGTLQSLPADYAYQGASCCKLACGGRVVHYTLAPGSSAAAAPSGAAAADNAKKEPLSPRTVLHHVSSSLSSLSGLQGAGSVSLVAGGAGGQQQLLLGSPLAGSSLCDGASDEPASASDSESAPVEVGAAAVTVA